MSQKMGMNCRTGRKDILSNFQLQNLTNFSCIILRGSDKYWGSGATRHTSCKSIYFLSYLRHGPELCFAVRLSFSKAVHEIATFPLGGLLGKKNCMTNCGLCEMPLFGACGLLPSQLGVYKGAKLYVPSERIALIRVPNAATPV
jgi:hypothetical protein